MTTANETDGSRAAKLKLAKLSEHSDRDIVRRNQAARDLFTRLVEIAEGVGLTASTGKEDKVARKNTLNVGFKNYGNAHVEVSCAQGTVFLDARGGSEGPQIRELEYDPVAHCFTGVSADGSPIEGIEALADVIVRELTKAQR